MSLFFEPNSFVLSPYGWVLALFLITFSIGILAVMGGIGGSVLFVPIVSGFSPFHLDFIRSTGLLVALSCSVAAGPGLLKRRLASIPLTLPVALISSIGSIGGALLGLKLPVYLLQLGLGILIFAILLLMLWSKNSDFPRVPHADKLSTALGIHGIYYCEAEEKHFTWQVHRTKQGLIIFFFIGFIAGMFGLGAGWANVPTLNLLMGAPLKVAAATSNFLLSVTDTSAAWVYFNSGAVLPILIIPSVLGIMLGSFIGVRLLSKTRPKSIRVIILCLLLFASIRSILKGLASCP